MQCSQRLFKVVCCRDFRWEEDQKISHIQFADNTLVFCKRLISQLKLLRCVIHSFEAVSGLKVNLSKSCIYGVDHVNDLWRFAELLGCLM